MIKQVAVFLENKPMQLAKCTKLLAEENINIFSLTIVDNGNFGIIRFIVDVPEKCFELFKNNNFTVAIKKVIAIELENKIGSLYELSKLLGNNNINIEDSYGILSTGLKTGIFVLQTSKIEKTITILKDNNYKLINSLNIL